MKFEMRPRGPFTLAQASTYFGDWVTIGPDQSSLALTFPIEGWQSSAAVILSQHGDSIRGEVHGTDDISREGAEKAWQQALASLSHIGGTFLIQSKA